MARVFSVGLLADGTYGQGWNGVAATSTHGVRGLFYRDPEQLGAQMFHVVFGFLWAWGLAWVIFTFAKNFMKIRVSREVELEGLDMPEFGVLAYPDFVLHHSPAGHVATDAEPIGNGAPQTVDLEQS